MRQKPASSASASSEDGRFPAGTLLSERYRLISIVGRGGMGEVYRASDLKLNQPVALKFLPAAVAAKPGLLERFHGEVRIARQVSHPNVCRVYDIGEAEGSAFISMEYVDGEDLGSLLRRIGRLPHDKAVEIGRKLCAGLAAAHAKGVLHRDLKPANIMIDGRGQVLIMDFGLAALADQVAGAEVRNGTPAYMAPEQLAGKEVSERSDIYALGLVLYEVFTGQRAFKTTDRSAIPSTASVVRDVDPLIERVIARCLEPEPAKRPQSALAVARMLPGGDPLAEALAAGDTPSPEMVAASEDTGALSVPGAVACLGVVVVGLAALVFWGSRYHEINITPMPYSPDVLTHKVHEMEGRFGYTDAPVDENHAFEPDTDYHNWALKNLKAAEYREQWARQQPSGLYFAHTDSPQPLVPISGTGIVSLDDPPRAAGTIDMRLDPQGRLVYLRVTPRSGTQPAPEALDWSKLLDAAGLDPSRWTPAEPHEIPPVAIDERKAWTGTYSETEKMPLRIEAAAWQGHPVYFEMFGPWRPEKSAANAPAPPALLALLAIILAVALLFALLNFRAGRGDSGGALRLAWFFLICNAINGFLTLHHTAAGEIREIAGAVEVSLFGAAIVWTLYMALEPYVRRNWSQALIGWTRALSGRLSDPLVAGHLLIGIAAGIVLDLVFEVGDLVQAGATFMPALDPFRMLSFWVFGLAQTAAVALGFFFLFLLLRLLLRRTWIAVCAVVVLLLGALASQGAPLFAIGVDVVAFAAFVAVSIRFGMLALTAMLIAQGVKDRYPLTANFSAWFAPLGWLSVAMVLAAALWCFRYALGGRKVWKVSLLAG